MPSGIPEVFLAHPVPDSQEDFVARIDAVAEGIQHGRISLNSLPGFADQLDRVAQRIKEREMAKKGKEPDKGQEFLDQLEDEVEVDKILTDFLDDSKRVSDQQQENG